MGYLIAFTAGVAAKWAYDLGYLQAGVAKAYAWIKGKLSSAE